MNISHQIDQLSVSLLQNFSDVAKTDLELAALILDFTFLLKKLKVDATNEQQTHLIVNDLGKVLTHIILKESK